MRSIGLTEDLDPGASGPDGTVALGLTAVISGRLEAEVLQVEQGQSVLWMLGPLPVLVRGPGDSGTVRTPGGSAGQIQT